MSDPTDPRWAPPGNVAPEGDVRATDEPPPPPPPPHAGGGWAPPESAPSGYGPGAWQPPPAPRRRTGLVLGIIAGVVVLVVALGVGTTLVLRAANDDAEAGRVQPDAAVTEDDGGGSDAVPTDDLVSQTEAVLQTINESEERMIAFQDVLATTLGDDGTVGDAAAQVARAAQAAGDDLTDLRSDLQALAGGEGDDFEGLRDIRDTYATHMEAWIEYLDAVAGSPSLASPDSSEAEPLWREIELSGNDFVAAVESGLPSDVPASLEELARFIVERGFGGFDPGGPGDVV